MGESIQFRPNKLLCAVGKELRIRGTYRAIIQDAGRLYQKQSKKQFWKVPIIQRA